MTTKRPHTHTATETVWLARMDLDQTNFSGFYILASPDPPILERRHNNTYRWHSGDLMIPSRAFHHAIKGIRLQPGEGPRKIELTIKRAPSIVWLVRFHQNPNYGEARYIVSVGPRPPAITARPSTATIPDPFFPISLPDFRAKFSGISPCPGSPAISVTINATPVDIKAQFAHNLKKP